VAAASRSAATRWSPAAARRRFVADATVDGAATWDLDSGRVTASVRVKGPRGAAATLRMAWNDKGRHPSATVTGRALGDRLAATLPAP
jgi:hypothetical protein